MSGWVIPSNMERRKFIKSSCQSCAAVGIGMLLGSSFLEACATPKLGVTKATPEDGKILLPAADFNDGSAKLVRVTGYQFDIAVKKDGDHYLALVLMCTHAGHPLVKSGNSYYCTLHGSRFAANGDVETAPASKPMMHLPVAAVDDRIEITILKPVY